MEVFFLYFYKAMDTFDKRPNVGHPTIAMAQLQQTQREVLLYLLFYWAAYSPRWLLISPPKLPQPCICPSVMTNLSPPCSSLHRSLGTHWYLSSCVFLCSGRGCRCVLKFLHTCQMYSQQSHSEGYSRGQVEALKSGEGDGGKSGKKKKKSMRMCEWKRNGGIKRKEKDVACTRANSAHDDMLHYMIPPWSPVVSPFWITTICRWPSGRKSPFSERREGWWGLKRVRGSGLWPSRAGMDHSFQSSEPRDQRETS